MKETLTDLKERRSCRKYTAKPVEKEKLDLILEADRSQCAVARNRCRS